MCVEKSEHICFKPGKPGQDDERYHLRLHLLGRSMQEFLLQRQTGGPRSFLGGKDLRTLSPCCLEYMYMEGKGGQPASTNRF